jgi:hypothetical protein
MQNFIFECSKFLLIFWDQIKTRKMATLVRELAIKKVTNYQKTAILYQAIRHHWNKDYKPGPYPKTPEERKAAAKKYGLLPEEYEVSLSLPTFKYGKILMTILS